MGDSIDALMAPMSPAMSQMPQMPQMPHQEGPPPAMPPPPPPAPEPMLPAPKPAGAPMNLRGVKEAFLIFVLVVLLTNGMVVKQLLKLGLPMVQPHGLMSVVGAAICGLLIAIGFFVGKKFLL